MRRENNRSSRSKGLHPQPNNSHCHSHSNSSKFSNKFSNKNSCYTKYSCNSSNNSVARPTQDNISTRPPSFNTSSGKELPPWLCNSNNRSSPRVPSLDQAAEGVRSPLKVIADEGRTMDSPSTPYLRFHRRRERINGLCIPVSNRPFTPRNNSKGLEDSRLTSTLLVPVPRDEEVMSLRDRELFNLLPLVPHRSIMDMVLTQSPAPSVPSWRNSSLPSRQILTIFALS